MVIKKQMHTKLSLVGFMGSGKSTVGQQLAKRLAACFYETDVELLKLSGKPSINAIFEQAGEGVFRELETKAIQAVAASTSIVIATGGGAVTKAENVDALKANDGLVIYLKTDFEELKQRVKTEGGNHRPLFKDEAAALDLYDSRIQRYEEVADLVVETNHKTADEIVDEIITKLQIEAKDSGKKRFYIIGDPVAHSLSPKLHTAAYKALSIENTHEFLHYKIALSDLNSELAKLKLQNIAGMACTTPLKAALLVAVDELDESAVRVGAVNTVVNNDGKFRGYNTDWVGVVEPFKEAGVELQREQVAILGTGGAAKAACYGLKQAGATPIVFARDKTKGQKLAAEFLGEFYPLSALPKLKELGIKCIFNATTVGMKLEDAPDSINQTLVLKEVLHKGLIVFDSIYNPLETKLLADAKERGAKTINGLQMLLHQGVAQFKLHTGYDAPVAVMREAIRTCDKIK